MGVESPCTPDPLNCYHIILNLSGAYGLVRLCTLNSYLIVSISFYSCMGLCSPGGSACKEGDTVTAYLHGTCSGPGDPYN